MTEADWDRMHLLIHQTVYDLWRAEEMSNLDVGRAQQGAHNAVYALWKAEEMDNIDVDRVHRGVLRADGRE